MRPSVFCRVMCVRPGRQTPVLPLLAQRLIDEARPTEDGCRVCELTPSKKRPWVWVPGDKQLSAYRVVMAAVLGRPIEADEDVHHECETPRCVEPQHLGVLPASEHSAHHAEQMRREMCSVHKTPYDYRRPNGWGVCRACQRASTAAYRERRKSVAL